LVFKLINNKLKQALMFVAFSVVTVTVIYSVIDNSEQHDDHVNLNLDEQKAWREFVSKYKSN